jgi:hypothetical protein
MEKDNRYSPYRVALQTTTSLHLRLNGFHRFMHFSLTVLLPAFIIVMLGVSMYLLYKDGATDQMWLLLIVFIAPAMMMRVAAAEQVNIENGKVEVTVKKWYRKRVITFKVDPACSFEATRKLAYRTDVWEFMLVDGMGNRTVLFSIPNTPFNIRENEKDNLLEVLNAYTRPGKTRSTIIFPSTRK